MCPNNKYILSRNGKKVVTQPLEEDASTPHSSRINSHQLSTDSEAHKSQEEMMMRLIYYLGIMFNIWAGVYVCFVIISLLRVRIHVVKCVPSRSCIYRDKCCRQTTDSRSSPDCYLYCTKNHGGSKICGSTLFWLNASVFYTCENHLHVARGPKGSRIGAESGSAHK